MRGGLVGQQHLRVVNEAAGNRNALLLTAGQFAGSVIRTRTS